MDLNKFYQDGLEIRTTHEGMYFYASVYLEDKLLGRSRPHNNEGDARQSGVELALLLKVGNFPQAVDAYDRSHGTTLNAATEAVVEMMRAKGFDQHTNDWKQLALIHTEVSEAVQALKRGEGVAKIRWELVDALIRILHFLGASDAAFDLDDLFQEVMQSNGKRPYLYNTVEGKEQQ